MEAWIERFRLYLGLTLKDWRYVSRGININVANLRANDGGSGIVENAANLVNLMTMMCERIPTLAGVRAVFYVNRTIRQYLRLIIKAQVAGGGGLTFEKVAGTKVMMFDGVPVRLSDTLSNKEEGIQDNIQNTATGNLVQRVANIVPIRYTKAI